MDSYLPISSDDVINDFDIKKIDTVDPRISEPFYDFIKKNKYNTVSLIKIDKNIIKYKYNNNLKILKTQIRKALSEFYVNRTYFVYCEFDGDRIRYLSNKSFPNTKNTQTEKYIMIYSIDKLNITEKEIHLLNTHIIDYEEPRNGITNPVKFDLDGQPIYKIYTGGYKEKKREIPSSDKGKRPVVRHQSRKKRSYSCDGPSSSYSSYDSSLSRSGFRSSRGRERSRSPPRRRERSRSPPSMRRRMTYNYGPPPPPQSSYEIQSSIPSYQPTVENPIESRFSKEIKEYELYLLKKEYEKKMKELKQLKVQEKSELFASQLEYSMNN